MKCHFKEMEFCSADDGGGGTEEWFECSFCGRTEEIGDFSC